MINSGLKHIVLIFSVLLGSGWQAFGQDPATVKVIASAQKDKISIRWAPDNAVAWHYGNKYGYTLERYTILRDSALVSPPEKTTLGIFQPLPEPEWENKIDFNDYAAVAAQAIYGESFELTQNYSSDIVQVINKSKEQDQRFSFALYAADQSFRVAEMSGLAFVDKLVRPSEKYLYKIIPNTPINIYPVDSGSVYIGLAQFAPLPQPIDVEALFGDRVVMLKWNREFFERAYNSFVVERSEDGGNVFMRISEEPLINTFTEENPNSRYFYKMDSIENYKKYQYRVKGISPFGELGPPSEIVEGEGAQLIQSTAQIINHQVDDNKINLQWDFDKATQSLINGFVVQRGNNIKGPFEDLKLVNDPVERQFTDQSPTATNYYRVGLMVQGRKTNFSFPYLVQLEDSIPPVTPQEVSGVIDTLGRVTLTWAKNTETDLQGYRIYRSNFKNAEFSQITSSPVRTTQLIDTITLKTLSTKIYYKVAAVDFRNNTSEYSEIVEISKPDIIPPVPPVFSSVSSNKDGIQLTWINSSSDDVAHHVLYRRKLTDSEWTRLMQFDEPNIVNYLDSTVEPKVKYQYTIVATDEVGLESTPASPVAAIQVHDELLRFDKMSFTVNREKKEIQLSWKIEGSQKISNFLIYRSAAEESLTLYKKIGGDATDFIDSQLKVNTNYKYRVKAVLTDGSYGEWSEELDVAY